MIRVGVPDPLHHQRLTLAAQTPASLGPLRPKLFLRARHHRAARRAPRPSARAASLRHRSHSGAACAGPPPATRDMTFDGVVDQQAMHPEAVHSWITTTRTARPSRRSAVSRSLPSSASTVTRRHHPLRDPLLAGRTGRNQPGLAAEFQRHEHSSGRVATGWAKSVRDSLHECDWATAFYQIGCRPHRHGICLTRTICVSRVSSSNDPSKAFVRAMDLVSRALSGQA
jgi:hypothetical protein